MRKGAVTLFFLWVIVGTGIAQSGKGSIRALVIDEQDHYVENATVELLLPSDSSLVKAGITDKDGSVLFENISFRAYLLRVSLVGYTSQYSSEIGLDASEPDLQAPSVRLLRSSAQLQNVTVSARKPFIQKLTDRIVVNVENSIVNAGSSAFDVLERSPGIQIDPNDNISMRGRSGVIIMIDGKPSPMSGADLVNFLRGLPSTAIERIDLITNPSAKYDAAGNSGIIDIRMKKDQRLGANGSLTAGYGQGVYPKANAGGSFNYRNKKVNVFGNYNYAYRMNLNHLLLDRNFFNADGSFNGKDEKDNYTKIPLTFHTGRVGADFFPSKKTILGVVANVNSVDVRPRNNNNSIVIDNNKQPLSTFKTNTNNHSRNNNWLVNLNFKHTFDTTGRELTVDIDRGEYSSDALSLTSTRFFNLDGSSQKQDYILQGDQDGKLHFTTAKADYVNPLRQGAKWEAGFKTSFVSSDNDAKFFDISTGTPVNDDTKTNRFFYDETNNAGYVNVSKEFKKFNVQIGLRGEHTSVKTRQVRGDIRWDSAYFQIFPSAFFNYKVKEDQTLGISVSRRIDRPGYSQLNPFLFLIDVTTYSTGNPGLLPQFTWSYELSYTMKSINFTFGYSHTTDNQNIVIGRFKDVFPNIPADENVTVQIPVNLESSDYYGLTIAAPVKITKWWNMINNGNFYYNHFNGNLGGTTLNNGKMVASVSTNNNFTFKKGWSAEWSGSYNSGQQYGFMVTRSQWALGAGVQKAVWKNKGLLRLNISDIFWTNLPRATITYNNYIEYWHAYRETRIVNLTFTYRFGNNKVQAARRRSTGSEEERQRAGN